MSYLNTSYVKVKLAHNCLLLFTYTNLNTSYVKVKQHSNMFYFSSIYNLNTSYVKVKPNIVKELKESGMRFKYILC